MGPKLYACLAIALVAILALACGGGSGSHQSQGDDFEGDESAGTIQPQFVGSWRIYSESIYFDAGGGGGTDTSASLTRKLDLYENGTWEFGSSTGTWFTAFIDPADWDRWGADPYGPESKIVLEGWNGDVGDGPIEESGGDVDFFWLIYHVDEPDPGTVFIKFGHP